MTLTMKRTGLSDRNPKWGLKNGLLFILVYTAVFAVVASFAFRAFKGHSFIWLADGIGQHVRMLEYWGQVLRAFFNNPSQSLEMWSWNIGYGESTRALLNNIAPIGDPFALLAVFFPPEKSELLYNVLVIVRYYFVGVGFFVFCTQAGFSRVSSLAGCLCYAFCGFALFAGVKHPSFLLPMMYLPMICAGIERYYQKRKPLLLIIATFLAAAAGYYFFFMVTVLVIIYAAARFFHYFKKKIIKNFFLEVLKISGLYSLGVALAGFFALPTVLYFFEGARKDALRPHVDTMWAYPNSHYKMFFESFAMNMGDSYWAHFSFVLFAAFAVIAVIFMKKYRSFKFLLAVLTLFLLLPGFGYILTGFTYVSNRWIFGYAFIVTTVTMLVLDEYKNWGKRERTVGLAMLIGYPIFTLLVFGTFTKRIQIYGLVVGVSVACFFISDPYVIEIIRKVIRRLFERDFKVTDKLLSLLENRTALVPVIITAGMLMNLGFTANSMYNLTLGNYVSAFPEKGYYNQVKEKESASLLANIGDDGFYRADRYSANMFLGNDSLVHDYRGTSLYLSSSRYMYDFNKAFNVLTYQFPHSYTGLDSRAGLNALTGVKYFAATEDEAPYLPYGFKPYEEKDKGTVYKSDFALPIGYAYDSFMKQCDFDALAEVDKDDNMLQSIVLPDSCIPPAAVKEAQTIDTSTEIPYTTAFSGEVKQVSDNKLSLSRDGWMELAFTPGSGETYFELNQFVFTEKKPLTIIFTIGDITKSFSVSAYTDQWRIKRENILVNLGVLPQEPQTLKVTFSTSESFSFSSMQILNKDLSVFEKNVAERMKTSLQQVETSSNKISGTVTADAPGLLAFSIPANKGWSATVNGKAVDLIPANVSFFAVPIEAGENVVALSFETPGIKIGAVLSMASLVAVICLSVIGRKRRKVAAETDT